MARIGKCNLGAPAIASIARNAVRFRPQAECLLVPCSRLFFFHSLGYSNSAARSTQKSAQATTATIAPGIIGINQSRMFDSFFILDPYLMLDTFPRSRRFAPEIARLFGLVCPEPDLACKRSNCC